MTAYYLSIEYTYDGQACWWDVHTRDQFDTRYDRCIYKPDDDGDIWETYCIAHPALVLVEDLANAPCEQAAPPLYVVCDGFELWQRGTFLSVTDAIESELQRRRDWLGARFFNGERRHFPQLRLLANGKYTQVDYYEVLPLWEQTYEQMLAIWNRSGDK